MPMFLMVPPKPVDSWPLNLPDFEPAALSQLCDERRCAGVDYDLDLRILRCVVSEHDQVVDIVWVCLLPAFLTSRIAVLADRMPGTG